MFLPVFSRFFFPRTYKQSLYCYTTALQSEIARLGTSQHKRRGAAACYD